MTHNDIQPLEQPARRRLLQAGAAFALSVQFGGLIAKADAADAEKKYGAASMPGGVVDNPLVFVSLARDGTETIIAHRAEMGTGVRTSLPMVVADEMEADWSRVKIVQADANEARYGSQNVDGSRSMRHFLAPMRRVGASARQMLEAAAAAQWKVPVAEVQARHHEVIHLPTGRRLGYGELAGAAMRQPVPGQDQIRLKQPAAFRYIGKGKIVPTDSRDIAQGKATYGIDVRLPGIVYAVMARPPVYGGKLGKVDRRHEDSWCVARRRIEGLRRAAAVQPRGGRRRGGNEYLGGNAGPRRAQARMGRWRERGLRIRRFPPHPRDGGAPARQGVA